MTLNFGTTGWSTTSLKITTCGGYNLEYVETATVRIQKSVVQTLDCLGVNGWDLAVALEQFSVLWISDTLYKNKKRMTGNEPGNLFEMWRYLKAENRGRRKHFFPVTAEWAEQCSEKGWRVDESPFHPSRKGPYR